jgi:hypothetical protein
MIINQLFDTPLNEVSLGDYAKKATLSRGLAQMDKAFYPDKAGSDETIRRRTKGLDRAKQRSKAALANRPAPEPLTGDQRAELEAKLRELESQFDPGYEYSDDHSVWTRNRDMSHRIQSIRRRLAKLNEQDQLNEVDWKAWQEKMKAAGQGAKDFTQNVRDTGDAAAGMINAYGGSAKELAKQAIARPTSAAYNAVRSGLRNTADVAKGVYGDVKQGTQAVGQAVDTVGTDVGQGLQKVGRGVANVAGGTVGALGSVAGGATTGLGRAGVKGFNAGVQNVGGDAVDRAETNIFKPTSTPVEIKKQIDLKKKEIVDLETQLKTATPATGGAQKSMPFYGTNPATGQARTYDELLAKSQAGTTPVAPAALPKPTYAPGVGATPTNVTYSPAFGGNYYKQKPAKANPNTFALSGFQAPAMAETRIATALKKPVAEMLQMVETKEDVQKIKQFVDDTFIKYGAVNESAFAVRNRIIEHVTQTGAQRRREYSQRVAH